MSNRWGKTCVAGVRATAGDDTLGDITMLRRAIAVAMVTGVLSAAGCAKAPPPEKPSTADTGQSPRERAMQGRPANMAPKYQQQGDK